MGYRSEVVIKCNEEAYEKLEKVIFSNDWTPDTVKCNKMAITALSMNG